MLMLLGFMGFSQGLKQTARSKTVTFPNGDESIVITTGKQANLLKLISDSQTDRFESLELSNHEVVHQREFPGRPPGLDSLKQGHSQYTVYREEENEPKSSDEEING